MLCWLPTGWLAVCRLAKERERERHSSRIWQLGLVVGDSSGKLAGQMAELVGGGSAGNIAPDCVAVWDASPSGCLVGRVGSWLTACLSRLDAFLHACWQSKLVGWP